MKDESKILDWRSTGRRKARRTLYLNYVEFKCVGYNRDDMVHECGKTQINPPKDAPVWFNEIWPTDQRCLPDQSLQADHETKDVSQNDIEHLNWRCASCHKLQDQQTNKGQATVSELDIWGNPMVVEDEGLNVIQKNELRKMRKALGLEEEEEEDEPEEIDNIWGT